MSEQLTRDELKQLVNMQHKRIKQVEQLCSDMYFQWEHENDNPQSYSGYLQRLLDDFKDRMADLGLL